MTVRAARAALRALPGGVAVLLAAAAIALVVGVTRSSWPGGWTASHSVRPELRELVAAMSKEPGRPVAGRLTGGFRYAPLMTHPPTGWEASSDVLLAAARIQKLERTEGSAERRNALGAAYLMVGEIQRSVEMLEQAAREHPKESRLLNDLSVAYLARATTRERADDWPKALAFSERAIRVDPTIVEARFNRALALEALHLDTDAAQAWKEYRRFDSASEWSKEANEHIGRLTRAAQAPSAPDHQQIREQIEDDLLRRWGEAVLANHLDTAQSLLAEGRRKADALAKAGGDSMARDEIVAIERLAGDRSALESFAGGHVLYGQAREQFLRDRLGEASRLMSDAATQFRRVNSPYALWAPVFEAITVRMQGSVDLALQAMKAISVDALPPSYFHLRGRVEWTRGASFASVGQFDRARESHLRAVSDFGRAAEIENLSANLTNLAEAEWFLGERSSAWSHQIDAMRNVPRLRVSTRLKVILISAALNALEDNVPEAALHFQTALVRSVEGAGFDYGIGRADAYMQRAQIFARLGQKAAASDDLTRATRAMSMLDEQALRDRSAAEISAVRGEMSSSDDHRNAVSQLNASLSYFQRIGLAGRRAELLMLRAKNLEALGDTEAASRDLFDAVEEFEHDREGLSTAEDRMQAFAKERAAFRELIRFEAIWRGSMENALRIAERGRARVLVEGLRGGPTEPLDPVAARLRLPADVALVYYVTLDDRVLTWVLTNRSVTSFERHVGVRQLQSMVDHIQRVIREGGDLIALASAARDIVAQLVEPALRNINDARIIIFAPDGPLFSVPFGALPDSENRPLIATHAIGVAPSLTTLLAASSRLTDFDPADVLAVGDGQDPHSSGLPRLRFANQEAIEIGRLYPKANVLVAGEATRARVLATESAVFHFSGHTVVNLEYPLFSRLMLAPDRARSDTGVVLAGDIVKRRFTTTRVAVLATCDGAAGRVIDGEGLMSVVNLFLGAGVPSVVGSLWPVEDEAHPLLLEFHRQLRTERSPVAALRGAQLALLDSRGSRAPVRLWGGFVAFGGVTPSRLLRKDTTHG
jgi:CHAT domain-containing protein